MRHVFLAVNPFPVGGEYGEIPGQGWLCFVCNVVNRPRSLVSCCITAQEEFWVCPRIEEVAKGNKQKQKKQKKKTAKYTFEMQENTH